MDPASGPNGVEAQALADHVVFKIPKTTMTFGVILPSSP